MRNRPPACLPLEPRRLLASIGGTVFYDLDLDGTRDADDVAQPGVVVFADANHNGVVDGASNAYASGGASRPINDNATFTVPIGVANFAGNVGDVDVRVNLTHSYLQDVDLILISPAGTRVTLSSDNGLAGQNFANTIFDDDAPIRINGAQSTTNYDARYRPEITLGSLNGQTINGTWTLEVTDDSNVDTGTFLGWGLTIRNGEADATTFADGAYLLETSVAGTYPVRPVLAGGYAASPAVRTATISATVSVANADFGVRLPPATIQGRVFNDLDASGAQNGAEPGLANRVVFLDADDDGQRDPLEASTTTDASGNYGFTGRRPQAYKVRTVVPVGWTQTSPAGAGVVAASLGVARASRPLPSVSGSVSGSRGTGATPALPVSGEVIVAIADRARLDASFAKSPNRSIRQALDLARAASLGMTAAGEMLLVPISAGADAVKIATRLASLAGVAWASPNYVYAAARAADPREYAPNDPQFGQQPFHNRIGSASAWDLSEGAGVKVGVVDDGVLLAHPDLAPNVWTNPGEVANNGVDDDGNGYVDDVNGWDFTNSTSPGTGDRNPNPENGDGHGTHVAGVIAARTNNGLNVSGVAGRATIVPIRFFGSGAWTSAVIFNAFKYAADVGCKVVNVSYNVDGFASDPTYLAAVDYMHARGVLHVNSAGNENRLEPARAAIGATIYVASVDASDRKLSDANHGLTIDLSAPGEAILSTTNNNGSPSTGTMGGSSVASAVASGVAALIWARNPAWTRDQVAARLLGTATNIDALNPDFAGLLGAGRVSASAALSGTLAAPRLGVVEGLPAEGGGVVVAPTAIRVPLPDVLDAAAANNAANFQLLGAGADNAFGTADDVTIPLTRTSGTYRLAANAIEFTVGQALGPGSYRFVARSGTGNLRDPFGAALDGDGNGSAGGDRVVNFAVVPRGAAFAVNPGPGATAANVNFGTRLSTVAPPPTPPTVTGISFEFAQRRRVTIQLSEPTTAPAAGSVTLRHLATGTLLPAGQYVVTFDAGARQIYATIDPSAVIADGDYRVVLAADGVRDLDSNSPLPGPASFDFFFVNADFDRDADVDFNDLVRLAQSYGSSGNFTQGDANYDGTVNFADLVILAQNYGNAPLAAVAPARGERADRVATSVLSPA